MAAVKKKVGGRGIGKKVVKKIIKKKPAAVQKKSAPKKRTIVKDAELPVKKQRKVVVPIRLTPARIEKLRILGVIWLEKVIDAENERRKAMRGES